MKRTHNKVVDSDDDMDNLPLKYISSRHNKDRSLKELKRYSVHSCEFCEKKLENRFFSGQRTCCPGMSSHRFIPKYDYFIHNAKHIIIPLIKMLPYYCTECGLYCLSEEEMNDHVLDKHKNRIKPKNLNDNDSKTKVSNRCNLNIKDADEDSNEDEKPLKSFITKKKEKSIVQNNVTDNILQNLVMNCKVDVEKFIPPWIHQSNLKIVNSNTEIDTLGTNFNNHVAKYEPSTETSNAAESDKVRFKNNIEEYKTSAEDKDLIDSDVDNLKSPGANRGLEDPSSEFSNFDDDPIVILTPPIKESVTKYHTEHNEHNSIHFDDLIKPGIFYCKRCFKRFPNRYEVIVHEVIHLDLSKVAPESYKVKLKNNSTSSVPIALQTESNSTQVTACEYCNENNISDKYLHEKTCITLCCIGCGKTFNDKAFLTAHESRCNAEAVVNMCDTCLYLRNRPKHVQYNDIIRFTTLDVKRMCHWCGKLCEDISFVTLKSKQVQDPRLADRIKFEGEALERDARVAKMSALKKVTERVETQRRGANERGAGRSSKTLSNWDRLKLIQNRLKLMKK